MAPLVMISPSHAWCLWQNPQESEQRDGDEGNRTLTRMPLSLSDAALLISSMLLRLRLFLCNTASCETGSCVRQCQLQNALLKQHSD